MTVFFRHNIKIAKSNLEMLAWHKDVPLIVSEDGFIMQQVWNYWILNNGSFDIRNSQRSRFCFEIASLRRASVQLSNWEGNQSGRQFKIKVTSALSLFVARLKTNSHTTRKRHLGEIMWNCEACAKICVITSKHKHKTKRTPPYHHHHHRNNCYRRIIGTKGALRIPTTYDNHPSIPYIDPIPSIQPTYISLKTR